jgi:hypothetical protein
MDANLIEHVEMFLWSKPLRINVTKEIINASLNKRSEWKRKDICDLLRKNKNAGEGDAFPLDWFLYMYRQLSLSSIRDALVRRITSGSVAPEGPNATINYDGAYHRYLLYATLLLLLMAMEFAYTCSLLSPDNKGGADLFARISWPFAEPKESSVYAYVKQAAEARNLARKTSGFWIPESSQRYEIFKLVSAHKPEYIFGDVPWVRSGVNLEYIREASESDLRVMLSLDGMRMRIGGKTLRVTTSKEPGRVVIVNEADGTVVDNATSKQTDTAFCIIPTEEDRKKTQAALKRLFHGVKELKMNEGEGYSRHLVVVSKLGENGALEVSLLRAIRTLRRRERSEDAGCGIM